MKKFSIIVPVYKVEKYLKKCIDSLLSQSYTNYEIILVDDGSQDTCPQICDTFSQMNENVKVIHKVNGGLSSARNEGIKKATGEYIIFVDSDDYWNDENALKKIYSQLEKTNPDVFWFNNIDLSCINGKYKKAKPPINCEFIRNSDKHKILQFLFESNQFPGAAWVTATNTNFIKSNNLFFVEEIKAEDIDWLLNVFLHANSYDCMDLYFYVYLKYRNGSITDTADLKSVDDILFTIKKWTGIITNDKYDYIRDFVNGYLSIHYICALLIINNLNESDKKHAISDLKKYQYLLRYKKSLSIKTLSVFLRLFGLKMASKVLNISRQFRKTRFGGANIESINNIS